MKIFFRKFKAGIIMLAISVFMLSYSAVASYDITVLMDGKKLECSEKPVIIDGTAFVPMRDFFRGLGTQVKWDEKNRVATANYNDNEIAVYPDSGVFEKNGKEAPIGAKPVIVNDKILLPIRTVAQILGCQVMWRDRDYTVSVSTQNGLKVYFLDCGQADSIFAELPDGKCMLIDAGESSFGKELESFVKNKGYSHIDYIVATHPHSDHIGGMAHILKSFTAGTFYMPDVMHTTKTYERMIDALSENKCPVEYIFKGSIIADESYRIDVLSPQKREYIRLNDYSAVLKLTYKDVSMLFSADAEATAEEAMVSGGVDLKADILKVGHHGNGTSSTDRYLDAVLPKDAVITVSRESQYGFPSALVLMQLKNRNINVYRTDIHGNVTAITDGYVYVIE